MKKLRFVKRVIVKVPATSGNIGPGFDVLGLALNIYNELRVRVIGPSGKPPLIRIEGEGEKSLPRDSRNIIFKAIRLVFNKAKKPLPQLDLRCINRIPLERGLGSSAAATISGLLAGNRLLGDRFSNEDLLGWASAFEGHPDDVAPALLGGIRASASVNSAVVSVPWPIPPLRLVMAVPDFALPTVKARKVLPRRVPLKDAVFNLGAVAVMHQAFCGHAEWLRYLLNDRLHEPYRAKLVPGFYRVKEAALRNGAVGVTLSGAGPTMVGFVKPAKAKRVARAMKRAFKKAGVDCSLLILSISRRGALVK
ncbi:MAG: homoserine kinase [Elusimicrobia bacterium]|nr:homoserine kinase [Candidatus Obscuribacterium magneticum]